MDRPRRENRSEPLRFTKDLGGPLATHIRSRNRVSVQLEDPNHGRSANALWHREAWAPGTGGCMRQREWQ